MKHVFSLALLLCTGLTLSPAMADDAEGPLVEQTDAVGQNIVAEVRALMHLSKTIRAEIEAGNITLSQAAEGNWAKGRVLWQQVQTQAEAGEYGPAYKTARRARHLVHTSFKEAFTGKPPTSVVDALKGYIDSVKPRVSAITHQIENYQLTLEGRESYHVAMAMYSDARKYAKKKKWDPAFRSMCDALAEYDKVVYEAYPTSR
jgi:uncharacterized NAD(P)/FAD-binding protein YdhS